MPLPRRNRSLSFADIALFLRNNGLHAPTIYSMDAARGLMLIEDFGNDTFTRILATEPLQEYALYDLAIDTLIDVHRINTFTGLSIAKYNMPTLISEAQLLTKWFFPVITGKPASTRQKDSYFAAWQKVFSTLTPHRHALVLRDYHVDNLMRVEQAEQPALCGLLDFQDALMGSPSYDLMSLIEDARRDVSDRLRDRCLQRYFAAMAKQNGFPSQKVLTPWLNVLAAQRHAKVLGIFVRLFKRDNKAIYLEHLPRVLALYTAALEREPALQPVRQWMTHNLPAEDIDLSVPGISLN